MLNILTLDKGLDFNYFSEAIREQFDDLYGDNVELA